MKFIVGVKTYMEVSSETSDLWYCGGRFTLNLQFAAKLPFTVTLFIAVHGNKQLGHRKTIIALVCQFSEQMGLALN